MDTGIAKKCSSSGHMTNNKMHLQYMGTCRFQDKLWFLNGGFNGLFSLDLKDFLLEFKQRIPFLENHFQWGYFGNVSCTYKNKLFFFPSNCKDILIYDVEKNLIQYVSIVPEDGAENYMTMGIVQNNEQVWMFPAKLSQGIFVLNLETLKLSKDTELSKAFNEDECINYGNIIGLNGNEAVILEGESTLKKVDVRQGKVIVLKRFENDMCSFGIRYDRKYFWLLSKSSTDLYMWNPTDDSFEKFQLLEKNWITDSGVPYANIIFINDQILILPCRLKYLLKIDRESHTIVKAVDYPKDFRFLNNLYGMRKWTAFAAYDVIDDNRILIHPVIGNMILIYNIEKGSLEGKELTITSQQVSYLSDIIVKRFFQSQMRISYEQNDLGLEVLGCVIEQANQDEDIEKMERVGQKIHDAILI